MKINADNSATVDEWDLRAMCKLGTGTWDIEQINKTRERITKTKWHKFWYRFAYRIVKAKKLRKL